MSFDLETELKAAQRMDCIERMGHFFDRVKDGIRNNDHVAAREATVRLASLTRQLNPEIEQE